METTTAIPPAPTRTTIDVTGLPPSAVSALQTLVAQLRGPAAQPRHAGNDEWLARVVVWSANNPQNGCPEYSRENIYDDDGR